MIARLLVLAAVLVVALLVTTVIGPLIEVGGVRPDLVLLSVIAVGFSDGRGAGARYGFVAGLLTDLLAGSAQLVGLTALSALLVGYLAGVVRPFVSTEIPGQVALAVAGTLIGAAASGLLALLLEASPAALPAVAGRAAGLALYHAVLAPLLFPLVAQVSRRLEAVAS